ncbi:MAG TPA: DoxX family protein [Thermoanaerobaculia bacterium]|jgi:putative oxidoreductase
MDQGILIARLVVGSIMAAHGAQKAFGWFGGHGLVGTGMFFEKLGFRPGKVFAAGASYAEITSGLLVAAGFLGPIGPALMLSVMIVAAISVHWKNGLFSTNNGIEVPLLYTVFAATIALTGPGRISLDELFGLSWLSSPAIVWSALVAGMIVAIANLALRRPEVAASAA